MSLLRHIPAFAAIVLLAGCIEDDPNLFNKLNLGAFTGANAQLLGNLISNTTGIAGDSVPNMLMAAEHATIRLAGEVAGERTREALALFERNGLAAEIGSVAYADHQLSYTDAPPPAHYAWMSPAILPDTTRWLLQWEQGSQATIGDTLPPRFGTITVGNGSSVSLAALDSGQKVLVAWSGAWQGHRMYMKVQWQEDPERQQVVSAMIPVLAVSDRGSIELPGENIARIVPTARGRLVFILNRGSYRSEQAAGRGVGVFTWVSETVYVNVTA